MEGDHCWRGVVAGSFEKMGAKLYTHHLPIMRAPFAAKFGKYKFTCTLSVNISRSKGVKHLAIEGVTASVSAFKIAYCYVAVNVSTGNCCCAVPFGQRFSGLRF
jgi:hypothetical protein